MLTTPRMSMIYCTSDLNLPSLKLGVNSPQLLVCKPTYVMVALTSLMSEQVNATIKYVIAPLEVGHEFSPN
jgi:hypothetical protein